MDPTVQPAVAASEPSEKLASALVVGDRIAAPLLPVRSGGDGAVLFVKPYATETVQWVFVAYVQSNGFHDSTTYRADRPVLTTPNLARDGKEAVDRLVGCTDLWHESSIGDEPKVCPTCGETD
jgi:hypothetical protein